MAREWGLELGRPFALARYSAVAPAGSAAVLKVTPVSDDESDHEPEALALWNGDGAVRLLRRDAQRRAMLLQRAVPGADISGLDDQRAAEIAVEVGRKLWRPAEGPFRRIADRVGEWLDQVRPGTSAGAELLTAARRIFDPAAVSHAVLVHGDFHHHNILDAGRGRYLAIDPKPMLGEPEFDVPPFLWNPLGSRITRESAERRLAVFAAAGLDSERMRRWTVIRGAYLAPDGDAAAVLLDMLGG